MAKSAAEVYVDSAGSWDKLNLDPRILQAIDVLGFTKPTLIQSSSIPLALEDKRDIIAKSSTGSGKTAAYCIPILQNILQRDGARCVKSIILVPTRELANQVTQFVEKLVVFCNNKIQAVNVSLNFSDLVVHSLLDNKPDIIVATPGKLMEILDANVTSNIIDLSQVQNLVIDEVDLILSYGYMEDLQLLEKYLPVKTNLQTFLMSATVNDEVDDLKRRFCSRPAVLRLNEAERAASQLVQFYARCSEFDKFLLTYVIFVLNLIKGKTLIFVNNIERGYRLKLFLEQFGIKTAVLNSELPVNSRLNIVESFNKGLYRLLIATDESNETDDLVGEHDETEKPSKKTKSKKSDSEFGVSRGVDFINVACVLNFDLPTTSRAYVHRIGRTARAGKAGMAISFVVPKNEVGKHKAAGAGGPKKDDKIMARIEKQQLKAGLSLSPYQFDMKQVESFRYRAEDAFRAVTLTAIREARVAEIKRELLNSEKLKRFFEENPQDLASLRHDKELHALKVQVHLKRVPEYLLPESARGPQKDVGFVPFSNKVHKKRKASKPKGKKHDVLKSFRR